MKNVNVSQNRKTKIACNEEIQTVEIGRMAIKKGILNQLPGSTLPIMLYLLTHCSHENLVKIDIETLTNFIPCSSKKIKSGLEKLKKEGIINYIKEDNTEYSLNIKIRPDKLLNQSKKCKTNKKENISPKSDSSYQELKNALYHFIPEGKTELLANSIEKWLEDFEERQLIELIRRVNKWKSNNPGSNKKTFYYMQGIIDDWYEKEIFTYERLQHFDRLFRETRELARIYGFNKWKDISPTQMEIFKTWISNKNALSFEVTKYAIKQAVKRKKDGQPSLKYIEDNFINPWKKTGIKTVQQAEMMLNKNNKKYKKNNQQHPEKKKVKKKWHNFKWDFSDLQKV